MQVLQLFQIWGNILFRIARDAAKNWRLWKGIIDVRFLYWNASILFASQEGGSGGRGRGEGDGRGRVGLRRGFA